MALARGPQQSKVPIPSSTGGVWARPLPCWSFAGGDNIGQGQLPGRTQGHYPTAQQAPSNTQLELLGVGWGTEGPMLIHSSAFTGLVKEWKTHLVEICSKNGLSYLQVFPPHINGRKRQLHLLPPRVLMPFVSYLYEY